jgi:CrcB protein
MFADKSDGKMKLLLLIGAGSFIGGGLRYLTTLWVQSRFLSAFPFGTLAVNVVGCFAIGLIFGFAEKTNLATEWRLFLATGICGGFTTFSAFSNETLGLLREGQYAYALTYTVLSVIVGLLATFLGYALARIF